MHTPATTNGRIALFLLVCCLSGLGSCRKKFLQDLAYRQRSYTDHGKPFSGKVYLVSNGSGNIGQASAFYTFSEGIPKGNFVTYGPAGEILQYGRFRPFTDTALLHSLGGQLNRVNISSFKQIDYTGKESSHFINIFLVTDSLPPAGLNGADAGAALKKSIAEQLLQKKIIDTAGNHRINGIFLGHSEFGD